MRITEVRIRNYRAHSNSVIPLSDLCCLIGENNSGKSTVLHAIQFALDGAKPTIEDFGNQDQPIEVELTFCDIGEQDLDRIIDSEHRRRVASILDNGSLTLLRSASLGESSHLRYLAPEPIDPRLSEKRIEHFIKETSAKDLAPAVEMDLPELKPYLAGGPKVNKAQVRSSWDEYVKGLNENETILTPRNLPTGISAAIKPLLPEPIYVAAVKDVSVEAKTSESATFGKLIKLLLEAISDAFKDIEEQFKNVQARLSRVADGQEGDAPDPRHAKVAEVESALAKNVQQSFPGVELQIEFPAPTLSSILSSARLLIDDGHRGLVTGKGDGLKRTVLFSIIRTYVEYRQNGLNRQEPDDPTTRVDRPAPSYILLFEEPELYLHPSAQKQLMSALAAFSAEHSVIATTHSPNFFGAKTSGFTKLEKRGGSIQVHPVDLNMSHRDEYQLVRYENNEAALFSREVLLVEGDSDALIYPHLASMLDKKWSFIDRNIGIVKIEGKGNVSRYRSFFNSFGVPVHVIVDLDALVNDFGHLTESKELRAQQSKLRSLLMAECPDCLELNSKAVRNAVESRNASEVWRTARVHLESLIESPSAETAADLKGDLETLFYRRLGKNCTQTLRLASGDELAELRDSLIEELSRESVYVLKYGDLEVYCKGGTQVSDKVESAINFCESIRTQNAWKTALGEGGDDMIEDLSTKMGHIFSGAGENATAVQ